LKSENNVETHRSTFQNLSMTCDEGVVINGVKWATRNVDEFGTFAPTSESAGKFYQWNRKKAWNTTDDGVTDWDSSVPEGTEWTKENDPSPTGWRIPTFDEIQKLFDTDKVSNEWTTQNGVNGRKFTDNITGNSVFLAAVGCRGSISSIYSTGSGGIYWSSTQRDSLNAYLLIFHSGEADWTYGSRFGGFSVRSVAE